jgi:hypothetical protein
MLLAGCGGSMSNGETGRTATRIFADSRAAASSAAGVHAYGSLGLIGGLAIPEGIRFNVRINGNREGRGTMRIQGFEVDVVSVGDRAYARSAAGFYTAFAGTPAAQARRMASKWLLIPAAADLARLITEVTDIARLVTDAVQQGAIRKGANTTVDGHKVICLTVSDGSGFHVSTVYIATEGKAYPVQVRGTPGTPAEIIHFKNWNEPVGVRTPN